MTPAGPADASARNTVLTAALSGA